MVQPTIISDTDVLLGTGFGNGTKRLRITKKGDGWEANEVWATRAISPYFNDAVVHQGQEEGSERRPGGIERLRRPPQGQEGVVHHVLRQDLLPGDPVGKAVGGRLRQHTRILVGNNTRDRPCNRGVFGREG